jgi:membrane-bound metal-dependent hydrolase YbcI (DUF457 family)
LHTFFSAFFAGLALGYAMFLFEKFFHPLYKMLLLEKDQTYNLRSFMLAGVLGTELHILLDSPLYGDIQPFYPITINPLYNPALTLEVYNFCVWMGMLGIIFYGYLLVSSAYKRFHKKR